MFLFLVYFGFVCVCVCLDWLSHLFFPLFLLSASCLSLWFSEYIVWLQKVWFYVYFISVTTKDVMIKISFFKIDVMLRWQRIENNQPKDWLGSQHGLKQREKVLTSLQWDDTVPCSAHLIITAHLPLFFWRLNPSLSKWLPFRESPGKPRLVMAPCDALFGWSLHLFRQKC